MIFNPSLKVLSVLFHTCLLFLRAQARRSAEFVTYGSVLKLMNPEFEVRLHSHDIKYGTGSGQQSVTATKLQEDVNSHWAITPAMAQYRSRGDAVKCGDIIRLLHLETKMNLHSHLFPSPLSGNQEVSAYGKNGEGDSGDHWEVYCDTGDWLRRDTIKLRHVDTNKFLGVSSKVYNRPITGQYEVAGFDSRVKKSMISWKAMEGVFVHPNEEFKAQFNTYSHPVHTEL
nr:PREDICTED: stromal cell-derived factor 2 [Bemisia tabaci]